MIDLSAICQIISEGMAEIKHEESELENAFRLLIYIALGLLAVLIVILAIVSIISIV